MSAATIELDTMDFELPPALEATEPPEAHGISRDHVRLLVGHRDSGAITHHRFDELPSLLCPGDGLVVNTSATLAAAVDLSTPVDPGGPTHLHFSTALSGGDWLVELRRGAGPFLDDVPNGKLALPAGGDLRLLGREVGGRLWRARLEGADVLRYLDEVGRPIRYSYVPAAWPLASYQTVFGIHPGSAEMPSAGRPFTAPLVARLAASGVAIIPITLHTGVASAEADEPPYDEWYDVSEPSARLIRAVRAGGGRIIAVGTTAVRALESAAADTGHVCAARGWTGHVVHPGSPVRAVDGLITGFHEPRASHLAMLEAIAGRDLVRAAYDTALTSGYRWHEFGDSNLYL